MSGARAAARPRPAWAAPGDPPAPEAPPGHAVRRCRGVRRVPARPVTLSYRRGPRPWPRTSCRRPASQARTLSPTPASGWPPSFSPMTGVTSSGLSRVRASLSRVRASAFLRSSGGPPAEAAPFPPAAEPDRARAAFAPVSDEPHAVAVAARSTTPTMAGGEHRCWVLRWRLGGPEGHFGLGSRPGETSPHARPVADSRHRAAAECQRRRRPCEPCRPCGGPAHTAAPAATPSHTDSGASTGCAGGAMSDATGLVTVRQRVQLAASPSVGEAIFVGSAAGAVPSSPRSRQ